MNNLAGGKFTSKFAYGRMIVPSRFRVEPQL
jgi:hypothetical protein